MEASERMRKGCKDNLAAEQAGLGCVDGLWDFWKFNKARKRGSGNLWWRDVRDVRDIWLVGNGGYLSLSLCFFFVSRSWFVWCRFESLKVIAGT